MRLHPTLKTIIMCRNVSSPVYVVIPLSRAHLPQSIEAQIKRVLQNPKLLDDAPHHVIYNAYLNPEANDSEGHPQAPPTALSISHNTRILFVAGWHTVGTTLMTGVYYLLRNSEAKQRLADEVRTAWPVLDQAPSYEELEKLPFLASAFICRVEFALMVE